MCDIFEIFLKYSSVSWWPPLWSGVGPRLLKPLGADKAELATKNEESSESAFVKLDWTEHLQISPPGPHAWLTISMAMMKYCWNECWKYNFEN